MNWFQEVYNRTGLAARFRGDLWQWEFPTTGEPSVLKFGYIGADVHEGTSKLKQQGSRWIFCGFDELTNHYEEDYSYMFSRQRKTNCELHRPGGKGEWNDRCDLCQHSKALATVPIRMRAACVDEGDVLTEYGWKPIQTVRVGEQVYSVDKYGMMTLKPVVDFYSSQHEEPLLRVSKNNLSMSMTQDHRVVYRAYGSSEFRITPWNSHRGRCVSLLRTATGYTSDGWDGTDDELAFIGLFVAEGCTCNPRNGNYKVVITQCSVSGQQVIRELLDRIGYHYCLCKNGDFVICNKALWTKLRPLGKAHEKRIPRDILRTANHSQLTILLRWLVFGDGHRRGSSIQYVTSSRQLADDVCEIAVKLSYKAKCVRRRLPKYPTHNDRYDVYLVHSDDPTTKVDKSEARNDVQSVPYSGMVYCIKVADNENFVIRQNGTVWISGNTNPGGPGADWVQKRFKIERDPNNGLWVGRSAIAPFVPAYIRDNLAIDQADYLETMSEDRMTDVVTRRQLVEGDWEIKASGRFKQEWLKRYEIKLLMNGTWQDAAPALWGGGDGEAILRRLHQLTIEYDGHEFMVDRCRVFMTVDPAGSEREGPGDTERFRKQPSNTVISTWLVDPHANLLWLDCIAIQVEVPDGVAALQKACRKWQPEFVGIEANGSNMGYYQYANRSGLPVREMQPGSNDKIARASDATIRMSQGKVFFPRFAPWLQDAMSEVFGWTGHKQQVSDRVDTLAYAAMMLSEESWSEDGVFKADDFMVTR